LPDTSTLHHEGTGAQVADRTARNGHSPATLPTLPPTGPLGVATTPVKRIKGLQCRCCGERYELTPKHVCEFCFGPLEVEYDYEVIRSLISREKIAHGPHSIWRYQDLLPVEGPPRVNLEAGFTPLVRAERP